RTSGTTRSSAVRLRAWRSALVSTTRWRCRPGSLRPVRASSARQSSRLPRNAPAIRSRKVRSTERSTSSAGTSAPWALASRAGALALRLAVDDPVAPREVVRELLPLRAQQPQPVLVGGDLLAVDREQRLRGVGGRRLRDRTLRGTESLHRHGRGENEGDRSHG